MVAPAVVYESIDSVKKVDENQPQKEELEYLLCMGSCGVMNLKSLSYVERGHQKDICIQSALVLSDSKQQDIKADRTLLLRRGYDASSQSTALTARLCSAVNHSPTGEEATVRLPEEGARFEQLH
ncbi:uncharacterized protein V6R79_019811 [Siganus canaliculatus]